MYVASVASECFKSRSGVARVANVTHLLQLMERAQGVARGAYAAWGQAGGTNNAWDRMGHRRHMGLLEMEIIALQSELTKFILAEVLEKDGVFSIAQSVKYKDQYGLEWLARLL